MINAPIAGWNARDPLSAMQQGEAAILENWIPGTGGVEGRFGHAKHAADTSVRDDKRIVTLMQYSAPSGGNKLFAASGEYIQEVTNEADVDFSDSPDVDGQTGDAYSYTMFGNTAGNFLVVANGLDPVVHYDGSTWTAPAITGADSETLSVVHPFASRLFFIEKQSTRLWYLGVGSIAGAAEEYDIGPLLKKGGGLVAMASWTRDGGDGADDVLAVFSSKGEVCLFSGIDPSDAELWKHEGTFSLAPPVGGWRCTQKAGADVGVITSQGVVPLSEVLPLAASDTSRKAVTNMVKGAFNTAYQTAGALPGWQILEYPRRQLMLVNVPQSDGVTFHQYVMNVATGAWCKFTGWNATCWELLGDDLYFGTVDGRVMVLTDDYLDDGMPITADGLPAFSNFGVPAQKIFLQAKPLFTAAEGTNPPLEVKTDFDLSPATVSQSVIPAGGTPWGSPWGSPWGPSIVSVFLWQSVAGIGEVASVRTKVSYQTRITWHGVNLTYQVGGPF